MHSKSNWYEFGEKSSKYFLNLEKRNKAKSHVRKIITENNSKIREPQEILLHIKEFYSTLYKRRSTKGEEEIEKTILYSLWPQKNRIKL